MTILTVNFKEEEDGQLTLSFRERLLYPIMNLPICFDVNINKYEISLHGFLI